MPGPPRKIVKILVFLAFAGGIACVLFLTPLGSLCATPEGRKELVARIDDLVRSAGVFGPAIFVLIYGVGVLALPATPFTAAGSFIFGKYLGAAANILGVVLGASVSFALGRYLLRDLAQSFLTGRLGELDRKAERHGFPVIFYLRILWFPFIVLNYAAGATRIRFRDFFWGTLFGTLPAIVIVSFFFGSLKEIVAAYNGPADLVRADVLVPAALLGVSFFLPGIVERVRKARARGSDSGAGTPAPPGGGSGT